MTAVELYNTLSNKYSLPSLILCDLHKPCDTPAKRRCEEVLSHKLINFDEVKTAFYTGTPGGQGLSADGYTFKNEWFCFVELKGWRDYLSYNPKATVEKIKKQADKYDLSEKYQNSVFVCQQVTGEPNLFKDKKIAFFLVTDIETERSGISMIADDLNFLATKTPSKEDLCNDALKSRLDSMPEKVSKFYVKCSKFDIEIGKLP